MREIYSTLGLAERVVPYAEVLAFVRDRGPIFRPSTRPARPGTLATNSRARPLDAAARSGSHETSAACEYDNGNSYEFRYC